MPSSSLIVLTGPPLPGRWSLARALERRLGARRFLVDVESVALFEIMRALAGNGGGLTLVDGDLPSAEARAEVLELGHDACERVLVEWRCSRKEAEREVFHRYASRPRVLGAAELERYFEDSRIREPPGEECEARRWWSSDPSRRSTSRWSAWRRRCDRRRRSRRSSTRACGG